MSDDLINLEVDGQAVTAKRGQMLIEVTDAHDRYVPRFCYHEKLSVAANCRMCLVEVEKAPKPLPACATPVAEGMKVFTRSAYATAAQKATMEFLLINHPLDCPICDQGGECELQDLAMGYGRDVSRYTDKKRVVSDKNIGPLVSTDMTRCIHCTRCVRFGQEIAGIQELGTTDRGEDMKIGTYIAKSVDHELSGNIIDLCPVGALNNKPYRYSARAWEMTQNSTVSPHDCVGSNLYVHTLRGTVKRLVPKPNEAINETWIADRDRFSYEAIYASDRLMAPEVRDADGNWQAVGWDEALQRAAAILKDSAAGCGFIASPSATVEEHYLVGRVAAAVGSANVDHRLRQRDFAGDSDDPAYPSLGVSIEDIETRDAILLLGTRIRHEAPILAHRVRKAAVGGAAVAVVDTGASDYRFDLSAAVYGELLDELLGVAKALKVKAADLPDDLGEALGAASADDGHKAVAAALSGSERCLLLLGQAALSHPGYSALRRVAGAIAAALGATVGLVTPGANSAGAALVGALPHREAGGAPRVEPGLDLGAMLEQPLAAYLLLQVEPAEDIAIDGAPATLGKAANGVVALVSHVDDALRETATVLLPVGTFAETSGTYVNAEGRWQSFAGVATPVGEARPAWKVLRVLANRLGDDADFLDSAAVLEAARAGLGPDPEPQGATGNGAVSVTRANGSAERLHVPIYEVDMLTRRARALQLTSDGKRGRKYRRGASA